MGYVATVVCPICHNTWYCRRFRAIQPNHLSRFPLHSWPPTDPRLLETVSLRIALDLETQLTCSGRLLSQPWFWLALQLV